MQQLALDIDDEALTRDDPRGASDHITASLAAEHPDPADAFAHAVNQPLAAIVARAYACSRWLTADPPNIERARIAAECIIRDAYAAAEAVNRLEREPHLSQSAESKGTNGRD
jgi:hypothetical protein